MTLLDDLRKALKSEGYQGELVVLSAFHGNQIIQIGIRSVEVGPLASIEDVKAALSRKVP